MIRLEGTVAFIQVTDFCITSELGRTKLTPNPTA